MERSGMQGEASIQNEIKVEVFAPEQREGESYIREVQWECGYPHLSARQSTSAKSFVQVLE